jgi:glucose/arabinose dehydrogenase/plastocyanin
LRKEHWSAWRTDDGPNSAYPWHVGHGISLSPSFCRRFVPPGKESLGIGDTISRFKGAPLFVVALLLLSGLATPLAAAQDATPVTIGEQETGQTAQPGGTLPGDPSVQLVKVAEGLIDPVNIASAGDGSGRIFVVERTGTIRIITAEGELLPEPYLDISNTVKIDFLEQGLLGLAFHPRFTEVGKFYVYYTDYRTNGDSFVVQFQTSATDPNVADPDSARVLFTQDQPYVNHNGGTIHFGPDGYLYIALGDGGLAGDPYNTAQDINTPLGSLLRIDVDAQRQGDDYGIPEGNPFAGEVLFSQEANQLAQTNEYHPGAAPEIWAYGLRNPWQFSFDPANGDLYIADVGQVAWEEINYLSAGEGAGTNFGWDFLEASHCYSPEETECGQVGTLPVAEYDHEVGCSITGMGVYRGEDYPSLDGIYFNSDFCSGRIWGLARDDGGTWQYAELLDTELLVTGSGQGEDGALYLTACECEFGRDYDLFENPNGTVWKLVSADQVPEGAETAPQEGATPEATPEVADEGVAGEATLEVGGLSETEVASPAADAASPAATDGSPATGAVGTGDEVTVESVDIDFNPNEFTIPANTDVTVHLPNNGAVRHNFSVEELGINVDIPPGEEQTITINAPAGEYTYYCDVPGHRQAGMVGTMTVE